MITNYKILTESNVKGTIGGALLGAGLLGAGAYGLSHLIHPELTGRDIIEKGIINNFKNHGIDPESSVVKKYLDDKLSQYDSETAYLQDNEKRLTPFGQKLLQVSQHDFNANNRSELNKYLLPISASLGIGTGALIGNKYLNNKKEK